MMWHPKFVLMTVLTYGLCWSSAAWGQPAPAGEADRLQQRLGQLQQDLQKLAADSRIAVLDARMCAEAVDRILRHEEFFKPNYVKDADKVLDLGFQRVQGLQQGEANWGKSAGQTVLAYRSRIDGSLQPYAVSLPAGFETQPKQRRPLHVVLHGRNANLNEVSFFASHEGKPVQAEQDWIQLDVFGRTNNAYRWAGETDVFEALDAVTKRYAIDERRITLWGFSMGGAGAWHLALHHPDRWSSAGAGAGFVDYYGYQKKTELLPAYQDRALRIYDATRYALNLSQVPMVTYGGEEDPQLLASLTMDKLAREEGVPLQVLVGPKMGHKFDNESFRKFMEFHAEQARIGKPGPATRRELQFETWTVKYNRCDWLTVIEQQEQYERSVVKSRMDADGVLQVETANVAALAIDRGVADRVQLDGTDVFELTEAAGNNLIDVYFVRDETGWRLLDYDESIEFLTNPQLRKRHNLQGPIDDAFMGPFLCVRGTGTPWSDELQKYADWTLARFEQEYDKYLRGRVPVKADRDVTIEEIQQRHLVLFGDPGSNALIAQVVEKLPLKWTPAGWEIQGQTYDPQQYAVVLIYPNPLNPERYVVINSGMTMHAADFQGTNALLFPKLGDIAVLRVTPRQSGYTEETVWAELFNTDWQLPE